ncbi:unnamed protein product [Moneuplotes crassus]|uniref:Calcium-dependent protein kinase n=1 Tax=Euplotes crassus TaxID=5936 RepID=A0AAD1ULQ7_EUPCR|nr:unnamed protein product [Moneuplotes crassus]
MLSDYRIGKVLGVGVDSQVRICSNVKSGVKRAVKIYNKRGFKDCDWEQFSEEVEKFVKIDHPNISRIFQIYEDKECYYIVTELCIGGRLIDQISSRPSFGEKDAVHIMKQIFFAVSYCHAEGINNTSLQLENILFEYDGPFALIKLVDLCSPMKYSACDEASKTSVPSYYISPEVLAGVSHKNCDIWACGVIMYILLCGRPPFNGDTEDEILENISKGHYSIESDLWENISEEGRDLLKSMLEFTPDERISSKDALKHPWLTAHSKEISDDKILQPEILSILQKFREKIQIQQGFGLYIKSVKDAYDEKKRLTEIYSTLDNEGSGQLTKEELQAGLSEVMGEVIASAKFDKIIEQIQNESEDKIDYAEFITSNYQQDSKRAEKTFESNLSLFNKDDSDYINASEIISLLKYRKIFDKETCELILKELDINSNGEIPIDELTQLLKQIVHDHTEVP